MSRALLACRGRRLAIPSTGRQAGCAHDLERVGGGARAAPQAVVERHARLPVAGGAFLNLLAEVVVLQPSDLFGQFGQLQVVRGDGAEAALVSEGAQVGAAADQALAVVGAAEDLVDQI